MSDWPAPAPLYNPLTARPDELLTPAEVWAGPVGLLAFLPLAILVRCAGPRFPRAAILLGGLVWTFATAGPWTTLVLAAALPAAMGYVALLARCVAVGRMSPLTMKRLTWLGFTVAILPLWWQSQWSWYGWEPSRMSPLHAIGLAYFYLRFIAWGVDTADRPHERLRPLDTLCWLWYAPIMRLGPFTRRETFLERFDAWDARAAIPWRELGRRFGLFLLGGLALGVIGNNIPTVPLGAPSFYEAPERYAPAELTLLRIVLLGPTQVYLLLWTYNELAAVCGLIVGIRVDNNFNWLPRATSVRDFWRRWHITVGEFLRNYVYIPLGGNRINPWLAYCATFIFCGVWHGAAWSFVVWGASQGAALAIQKHWDQVRAALGWDFLQRQPAWIAFCWLLTMSYQSVTIMIFTDFHYCGTRLLAELWRRGLLG